MSGVLADFEQPSEPRPLLRSMRGSAFELALAGLCFLVAAVSAATLSQFLELPRAIALLLAPLATGVAAFACARLAPLLSGEETPSFERATPQSLAQSTQTAVLAFVAAVGGSVLLGWISQEVLGIEVQEQRRILELFARRDPVELGALAVTVVLLAPLAEEWLFRWVVFRRLRHWVPLAWAAGLSSLLFAAVHANASGLATYVWLGLCFTFALHRSGRLGCAVFVHAANNAATFLLLFLEGQG